VIAGPMAAAGLQIEEHPVWRRRGACRVV